MRKTLTTLALTVGALGAAATVSTGAANADPMIGHNDHNGVADRHSVTVNVTDILTNTLYNGVLTQGINISNVQVLSHHNN